MSRALSPSVARCLVWRELPGSGRPRAPASIALSNRRRRLRSPIALVRRRMFGRGTGRSYPPAYTGRAIASYGHACALLAFARAPRRVRRVMRETGLLAPHRVGRTAAKPHDGTITTDKVNEMWGTDMTQTITIREGRANVFISVEHANSEVVGIHASCRPIALRPWSRSGRACIGASADLWLPE
jgi:hypothetical protein